MFTKQSECLCMAAAHSTLTRNEKDVFTYLIKRADETGKSWPSVATITADIGICEGTYKKAIKALIGIGLVRREFRFNKITGQQRSNYFFISPTILLMEGKEAITAFINSMKEAYLNRQKAQQAKTPQEQPRDNCAQKRDVTALSMVKRILSCMFGKKASCADKSAQNHSPLYVIKHQLFSGFFKGRGHSATPEITTYSSVKKKKLRDIKIFKR